MNTKKKRLCVGILFGGRSGEHEVSLASAASVIRGLDPIKYEAVPIGITKEGHWLIAAGAQKMLPEALKSGQRVTMIADPTDAALVPIDRSGGGQRLDVVFPVMHDTFGEDGTNPRLARCCGIALCRRGRSRFGDRHGQGRCQEIAQSGENSRCAMAHGLSPRSGTRSRKNSAIGREQIHVSVFVKPATLGSSVGMAKVHNREELVPALNLAAEFAMKILVEQTVAGRQIEVSVLGNQDPQVSVPGEIVPHREFYDYAAKYLEEGTQLLIPAKLKSAEAKRIRQLAADAFRTLELCGMARVDFFLEKGSGKIFLNEVNTIPGFTSISMYPKLWEASGIPFRDLIDKLIELAMEHHGEKVRTKYAIELPQGSSGALEAN